MEPISTGFNALDEVLDGGLYDGLYTIGAAPSMGKTTLALQIADYVAEHGTDVLFFTIDESDEQLLLKSTSRMTFTKGQKQKLAKTTTEIRRGRMEAKDAAFVGGITDQLNKSERAKRLHVLDFTEYDDFDEADKHDVFSKMRYEIEKYPHRVVIVDYLQAWASECKRGTDKQNVDVFVVGLKRISMKYQVPVIALSTVSRGGYYKPMDFSSFKESGQIECSSDVVLGLQFDGWDYKDDESSDARMWRITDLRKRQVDRANEGHSQRIQVKMLKNRWGTERDALLRYYPKYNCFEDCNTIVNEFDIKIKEWGGSSPAIRVRAIDKRRKKRVDDDDD